MDLWVVEKERRWKSREESLSDGFMFSEYGASKHISEWRINNLLVCMGWGTGHVWLYSFPSLSLLRINCCEHKFWLAFPWLKFVLQCRFPHGEDCGCPLLHMVWLVNKPFRGSALSLLHIFEPGLSWSMMVMGRRMMIMIIIIKVICCSSFAWCLLIQNSSEDGLSCYLLDLHRLQHLHH